MVYITSTHMPLARASHVDKSNINRSEKFTALTGRTGEYLGTHLQIVCGVGAGLDYALSISRPSLISS